MNRNVSFPDKIALQKMYKKHRLKIEKMRSYIDNRPGMFHTSSALQITKSRQDQITYNELNTKNKLLLQKIKKIKSESNTGYRRTENPEISTSKIKRANDRLEAIERSNIDLGCRILRVKSSMSTRRDFCSSTKKVKEKFEVPLGVLEKYSRIVLPQEVRMLEHLLRPKIFLEIEVRDIRPLGRIDIQLFTEACPALVLEFVRMCSNLTVESLRFLRIFPQLWVEAELQFDSMPLRKPDFEYDMYTINHARGPGVLSFAKCYLSGFSNGLINFSMSFKPLRVLNGERVPFGIITRGMSHLECLKDYGMKSGKTLKEVLATQCGIV